MTTAEAGGARLRDGTAIDALTSQAVAESMRAALHASTEIGAKYGLVAVTAGNYGGNLGRHHYHLRDLLEKPAA